MTPFTERLPVIFEPLGLRNIYISIIRLIRSEISIRCPPIVCRNIKFNLQVGQFGANAATFLDTGLLNNTQNNYRVRAFNPGGNSVFSNTVTAKTLRR